MKFLMFIFTITILYNEMKEEVKGEEEGRNYWLLKGKIQLKKAVKEFTPNDKGRAKNIIVFIGEGMGSTTITAARIYKALRNKESEDHPLNFEELPYTGMSRTYSVDKQVPDSAATATAILTGVKTKSRVVSMDGTVKLKLCESAAYKTMELPSVAVWAVKARKSVGIVTNSRITDATSAAMYAQTPDKGWECSVPEKVKSCLKDIGTQLVEDSPGIELRVILGGGRDFMGADKTQDCTRHRNLVQVWEKSKWKKRTEYVTNLEELQKINPRKVDYLLGLFSNGHMAFELERDKTDQPSLEEMTSKAISILKRNKVGYVLLVVGGLIDVAHRYNYIKLALAETVQFDLSVKYAMDNTNVDDTLIIVTSNYAQGLGIYGYPDRGTNILGKPQVTSKWDTLFYGTGPGAEHNVADTQDKRYYRLRDINGIFYQAKAGYYSEEGVNTGEDVPVYARGPGASLLVGSYEQNYIGHVISYASGMTQGAAKMSRGRHLTLLVPFLSMLCAK